MTHDARFDTLTFDGFRDLARQEGLSRHERVGFPDYCREGYQAAIWRDVRRKLTNLDKPGCVAWDIGCGCSDLPRMLADQVGELVLCDSAEMLDHLEDAPHVRKLPGLFPRDIPLAVGDVDAVLAYSVLQYVFAEGSVFGFLDAALSLLAPDGQLLIGDVPNASKRRRFFASAAGRRSHREYTGRDEEPPVTSDDGKIDDAVILSLLDRARVAGFDAYVLPQSPDLPMATRREDLLFVRP